MVSQVVNVTTIRWSVLLAFVFFSQIYALTTDVDQQCQQLVRELDIDEVATFDSLQHSCEGLRDYNTVNKAHVACFLASLAFYHKSSGISNLVGYIGPQSPSYFNHTESDW